MCRAQIVKMHLPSPSMGLPHRCRQEGCPRAPPKEQKGKVKLHSRTMNQIARKTLTCDVLDTSKTHICTVNLLSALCALSVVARPPDPAGLSLWCV